MKNGEKLKFACDVAKDQAPFGNVECQGDRQNFM